MNGAVMGVCPGRFGENVGEVGDEIGSLGVYSNETGREFRSLTGRLFQRFTGRGSGAKPVIVERLWG
jgi:adenosyl cobinamide kinase/adenosyl cobinamide phosphate guanylyltransferase